VDLKQTIKTFKLPKLPTALIDLNEQEQKEKDIKDKYYQR
jgi:hypothetical protein